MHAHPGQSLVEFALVLPVLLLLTLIAVDFGRVYLGWINLQNMARIGANFAANHPTAWLTPNDTDAITQYQHQMASDAAATNCTLNPVTPPSPTFSDADGDGITTGIGDHATVRLTCSFRVITPIISNIVGGAVSVSASAVFPVKSGITGSSSGGGPSCLPPSPAINANPQSGFAPLTVNFTDASGGGAGDAWAWDFGDLTTSNLRDPGNHVYNTVGTYVVTLSITNACGTFTTNPGTTITVGAATPKLCQVPDFVGSHTKINSAKAEWTAAAGFTTTLQQAAGHSNGNYTITFQSITGGTSVDCGSTMTVNG
ncbi:MAG: PKD domain-containing protein [Chloroflexi bacterium]|nr:PKD domain-containing protein [Chloroflexota bacterium]